MRCSASVSSSSSSESCCCCSVAHRDADAFWQSRVALRASAVPGRPQCGVGGGDALKVQPRPPGHSCTFTSCKALGLTGSASQAANGVVVRASASPRYRGISAFAVGGGGSRGSVPTVRQMGTHRRAARRPSPACSASHCLTVPGANAPPRTYEPLVTLGSSAANVTTASHAAPETRSSKKPVNVIRDPGLLPRIVGVTGHVAGSQVSEAHGCATTLARFARSASAPPAAHGVSVVRRDTAAVLR